MYAEEKLTQNELDNIVKQHNLWVNTRGVEGVRANFKEKVLCNLSFKDFSLVHADFRGAILSNCDLSKSNFRNSNFNVTTFENCTFELSSLVYCNFMGARGEFVNLTGAICFETNFKASVFKNTKFDTSTLRSSRFSDAILEDCSFYGADFHKVLAPNNDLTIINFVAGGIMGLYTAQDKKVFWDGWSGDLAQFVKYANKKFNVGFEYELSTISHIKTILLGFQSRYDSTPKKSF
jgi:uncharacterized protein YjbI with pentapeptide repeats